MRSRVAVVVSNSLLLTFYAAHVFASAAIISGCRVELWRASPAGTAKALAGNPRLLLLNEPIAGLGPQESPRLVAMLTALKAKYTTLLVEHDIKAVFALADRLTVFIHRRAIASGVPDAVPADPQVREAYLGEDEMEAGHG